MLGDRSLFPDLEWAVYFNHAAISPTCTPVREAAIRALDDYGRLGVGAWMTYREQRDRLRGKLATLIGAQSDEIGLVPSTSQGVVDIALCFPWRRGDRVVLFEGEFPANVTPWQRAAELFGLEITMLRASDFEHGDGLTRLEAVLTRSPTRLVAISAVEFQTGFRMPLGAIAELCHANGAEIFVDAIQAIGATPVDVRTIDVDYLVAGSHKWLMAPEGCGFVFVRRDRAAHLEPRIASWLSHEDGACFLFEGAGHLRYDRPIRRSADFVEIGAQNTVGLAALEAAVDILLGIGVENIWTHVSSILDVAERELVARGFVSHRAADAGARSTILSLTPPDHLGLANLFEHLAASGVSVSIPDGRLRLSPHWPNDAAQVESLTASIDAIALS